jgi:hypothetical protein
VNALFILLERYFYSRYEYTFLSTGTLACDDSLPQIIGADFLVVLLVFNFDCIVLAHIFGLPPKCAKDLRVWLKF